MMTLNSPGIEKFKRRTTLKQARKMKTLPLGTLETIQEEIALEKTAFNKNDDSFSAGSEIDSDLNAKEEAEAARIMIAMRLARTQAILQQNEVIEVKKSKKHGESKKNTVYAAFENESPQVTIDDRLDPEECKDELKLMMLARKQTKQLKLKKAQSVPMTQEHFEETLQQYEDLDKLEDRRGSFKKQR